MISKLDIAIYDFKLAYINPFQRKRPQPLDLSRNYSLPECGWRGSNYMFNPTKPFKYGILYDIIPCSRPMSYPVLLSYN